MTPEDKTITWQEEFGMSYWSMYKEKFVVILKEMSADGRMGEVVLDVGSGSEPVIGNLPGEHKLIFLDTARTRTGEVDGRLYMRGDIDDIALKKYDSKRAAVQIAHFLGLNVREVRQNPAVIDTVVMSDILNYLDWRKAVAFLTIFLKPDGRIAIFNKPGRGKSWLFHPQRPQTTQEVVEFLREAGFEIETDIDVVAQEHSWEPDDDSLHAILVRKLG